MLTAETVVALVVSGLVVGFINTLAAGATVISMTLYMALGMPILDASGTNRISVVLQNLVGSLTFRKESLLDMRQALKLSVPIVVGVLIGAQFSMMVSDRIFHICFAAGLVVMACMLVLKPSAWLKGRKGGVVSMSPLHFFLLVLAGFYGGSVYVGVGYFFIAIFVLGLGYDLMRANAMKGFMAFVTTPFSLVVFMMHGHVNYTWGLVHAAGNIIGSYIAARYARTLGTGFMRWLLISLIFITILDVFGAIDLGRCLSAFMSPSFGF